MASPTLPTDGDRQIPYAKVALGYDLQTRVRQ